MIAIILTFLFVFPIFLVCRGRAVGVEGPAKSDRRPRERKQQTHKQTAIAIEDTRNSNPVILHRSPLSPSAMSLLSHPPAFSSCSHHFSSAPSDGGLFDDWAPSPPVEPQSPADARDGSGATPPAPTSVVKLTHGESIRQHFRLASKPAPLGQPADERQR